MIATAPGKLFLLGEYAVLEGAPAIVATVAQCARVEVSPGSGLVHMQTGTKTSALSSSVEIIQAVTTVLTRCGLPVPALEDLDYCLDTSAFYQGDQKLGLGSSAALTVALVRALVPREIDADYLTLVTDCHREFQGGSGSGADIAAALLGGCILFRPGKFPSQLQLPDTLQVRFVWTGHGAGTVGFLAAVDAWRAENPAVYKALLHRLTTLSESGVTACKAGDADHFVDTALAYNTALQELSDASGTGFYSDVHHTLASLAAHTGCTYKPSGAGGGDFGVVFASSPDPITAFETAALQHGFDTTIASMCPALDLQEQT